MLKHADKTTKIFVVSQKSSTYRGVEQLVARQAHNLEVARSSPASATITSEVVDNQHFGFFVFVRNNTGRF